MEKTTLEKTASYESIQAHIIGELSFLSLKNEFLDFWEKWISLHNKLFQKLGLEVSNTFTEENILLHETKAFMTKRKGMLSAFLQKIKYHPQFKKEITTFKNILNAYDEYFKNLLAQMLENLSKELIRLQSLKKVTNAYTYTNFPQRG